MVQNNEKASSFCNDVIGDICGIVSGSMGTMIAIYITGKFNIDNTLSSLIIASIISSLTVGGKAMGKNLAVKKSDDIIFIVGRIINKFN